MANLKHRGNLNSGHYNVNNKISLNKNDMGYKY
jgi:hypothetical protein